MDIADTTPEFFIKNESTILKLLTSNSVLNQIPLLNANELCDLRENHLVRFYGMVQDMKSPEFYLKKFEVLNNVTKERRVKNGKYMDVDLVENDEEVDLKSINTVTAERYNYVVISVPGMNNWVVDYENKKYKINKKDVKMDVENVESKNEISEELKTIMLDRELSYPFKERKGMTCHVKIYISSDELKLNEIYEFIGFLGKDPKFENFYLENELEGNTEVRPNIPDSILIPRIHCICFKSDKKHNPLVDVSLKIETEHMTHIFKEIMLVLTQLLLGDELAAEYLIYNLISEVYVRRDFMPLGKFALNISNIPSIPDIDYVNEIYKFIEMFLTKSHYLPMTLENMNILNFIPKKDYDRDRLVSGIFQISSNTHIVLDETKLSPGQLNVSAVLNVRSITSIIKYQKLAYNFNFYPIEYNCDIPFLVFSEGKSMLPSDVHIPLQADQNNINTFKEITEAARHFLKPELLNEIRKYFTMARLVPYNICESIQEFIQNEFVEMRQNGEMTADGLHSILVLARLVAISRGLQGLTKECWDRACQLERSRKNRNLR